MIEDLKSVNPDKSAKTPIVTPKILVDNPVIPDMSFKTPIATPKTLVNNPVAEISVPK